MLEFVIAVGKGWFVYSLILKLLLRPAITVSKKTLYSQVFMSFVRRHIRQCL